MLIPNIVLTYLSKIDKTFWEHWCCLTIPSALMCNNVVPFVTLAILNAKANNKKIGKH